MPMSTRSGGSGRAGTVHSGSGTPKRPPGALVVRSPVRSAQPTPPRSNQPKENQPKGKLSPRRRLTTLPSTPPQGRPLLAVSPRRPKNAAGRPAPSPERLSPTRNTPGGSVPCCAESALIVRGGGAGGAQRRSLLAPVASSGPLAHCASLTLPGGSKRLSFDEVDWTGDAVLQTLTAVPALVTRGINHAVVCSGTPGKGRSALGSEDGAGMRLIKDLCQEVARAEERLGPRGVGMRLAVAAAEVVGMELRDLLGNGPQDASRGDTPPGLLWRDAGDGAEVVQALRGAVRSRSGAGPVAVWVEVAREVAGVARAPGSGLWEEAEPAPRAARSWLMVADMGGAEGAVKQGRGVADHLQALRALIRGRLTGKQRPPVEETRGVARLFDPLLRSTAKGVFLTWVQSGGAPRAVRRAALFAHAVRGLRGEAVSTSRGDDGWMEGLRQAVRNGALTAPDADAVAEPLAADAADGELRAEGLTMMRRREVALLRAREEQRAAALQIQSGAESPEGTSAWAASDDDATASIGKWRSPSRRSGAPPLAAAVTPAVAGSSSVQVCVAIPAPGRLCFAAGQGLGLLEAARAQRETPSLHGELICGAGCLSVGGGVEALSLPLAAPLPRGGEVALVFVPDSEGPEMEAVVGVPIPLASSAPRRSGLAEVCSGLRQLRRFVSSAPPSAVRDAAARLKAVQLSEPGIAEVVAEALQFVDE
eukprot:Hpha_TRINITY_DN19510_c0_g1::TRINITY_DN19510_c0_g1_i1::g.33675::m.33675